MTRIHLLIVSHGFAPWGSAASIRASKLAQNALRHGWRVSVMCSTISAAHVADDTSLLEGLEDAEIARCSDGTDRKLRRWFDSVLGYLPARLLDVMSGATPAQWAQRCIDRAIERWRDDPPDLVFATAPPRGTLEVGRRLAASWGCTLVLDFRDPPTEVVSKSSELQRLIDSCCRFSVNTEAAARSMAALRPEFATKIQAHPNGCDGPFSLETGPRRTTGEGQPRTLLYAGGLYPRLVDVAALLRQGNGDADWQLVVFGFLQSKRRRQVKWLLDLGVRMEQPVPGGELRSRLAAADAVLVPLPDRYDLRVPLKTYESIASGAPAVFFGNSRATAEVTSSLPGAYWCGLDDGLVGLSSALDLCTTYDRMEGWPTRVDWLQERTWHCVFRRLFAPELATQGRSAKRAGDSS